MKFHRRNFLHLAAGAAALPATSRIAFAENYPARPVRVIVGFPPGNAPDIIARLAGQWLSDRLGQSFIVEDRPGAGSTIATETVVTSPADGYTLLMAVLSNSLNAALYTNLKFDFVRDITPVARIANAPFALVVAPSLPAKTVPEFIAYAKANPGKINFASGGNGTSTHVFGELFKMMAGVDLVHVPYRGSYMADLLGGQVQAAFSPVPQVIGEIRGGKLRALGVTTAKRLDALSDVPAIGEFVPGYEAVGWFGLVGPKNIPADIVSTLNAAIGAALADPKAKGQLASLGVEPVAMTPAEFGKFIADDTAKWARVIKLADIKPD
jgi:tripartite-type tricarboxylate transporter receptor subunit TctC